MSTQACPAEVFEALCFVLKIKILNAHHDYILLLFFLFFLILKSLADRRVDTWYLLFLSKHINFEIDAPVLLANINFPVPPRNLHNFHSFSISIFPTFNLKTKPLMRPIMYLYYTWHMHCNSIIIIFTHDIFTIFDFNLLNLIFACLLLE